MGEIAVPRGRRDSWTRERRDIFLEVLAATGGVAQAAVKAGVAKSTAYRLRQGDAGFADDWALALESAADDFEAQLRRRVLNGVARKLHHQGKVFATQRVYSDNLAVYMLSRLRPMPGNPIAARREKERPARDICDRLTESALRVLAARAPKA